MIGDAVHDDRPALRPVFSVELVWSQLVAALDRSAAIDDQRAEVAVEIALHRPIVVGDARHRFLGTYYASVRESSGLRVVGRALQERDAVLVEH